MSSDNLPQEKGPVVPSTGSIDGRSTELSGAEELALKALEKRVLRKTDMVVLPMVSRCCSLYEEDLVYREANHFPDVPCLFLSM